MVEIYLITNKINGKKYVGQSHKGYKKRWLKHINSAYNSPNRGCVSLYRAIKKYGQENFALSLLEVTDKPNEREEFWIRTLESQNPKKGYNLTSGGDHFKMSNSCKTKLSQKMKGREVVWGDKVSVTMKERWKDPAYRKQMSEAHKGEMGYKYKPHTKPLRLKLDTEEINKLYKQGLTIYKIAKQLKVCHSTIKKRINK